MSGLELLTGIRFLALDMAKPFIDVLYSSGAVLLLEQLSAVKNAICKEFRVFQPKRIRFYAPSHLPHPLKNSSEDGDKRLLAAPFGVMLAQPKPETLRRVSLKRATSLTFYADYEAVYEELQAEHPELEEVVSRETQEEMQAYLENAHLFEIFVDGRWAGITAVDEDVQHGLSGLCMMEIILAKTFRAQGFGSAVQRHLAAELVKSGVGESTLLFGTIGENNAPAWRTAERVGRIDLGGYVWVPL